MPEKKYHPLIIIFNIILFSAVLIIHSVDVIDISIKNATPFLILPLLTAFSFYHSFAMSAITGFLCGAFIDSVASGSYCFNSLALMLIAAAVSLLSDTLFNKNIFAATVLSLTVSALYFIALWVFFHAVNRSVQDSLWYLLGYGLPSALYSSVFVIPLFYFYRFLENKKAN